MKPPLEFNLSGGNIAETPSFTQQAYDILKDSILYRKLQVDEIYSQDSLCKELGISRTPIREALLQLQQEGYIKFLRGRGVVILPLNQEDAQDIIEMRYHLEQVGSGLAAKRCTDEQQETLHQVWELMSEAMKDLDSRQLYELDRLFHRTIFEISGNHRMLNAIEELREHFTRIETLSAFENRSQALEVLEEHYQIYQAISEKDLEKTTAMMRLHMDCTYRRTLPSEFIGDRL